MPLRALLLAVSIPLLLLPLTGCGAANHDPIVTITPDLARPACRPDASLMCPKGMTKAQCVDLHRLPEIMANDAMVAVSARDTAAFNAVVRQWVDLAFYVAEECS